jgi:hypothetical protein
MYYGVGVFEQGGVLAGFEDIRPFPGYFVRPGWGVWRGGYGGPDRFAGAAGKEVLELMISVYRRDECRGKKYLTHLIDVTPHPLSTADLHILDPKKPFPPQTTILLTAAILSFPLRA